MSPFLKSFLVAILLSSCVSNRRPASSDRCLEAQQSFFSAYRPNVTPDSAAAKLFPLHLMPLPEEAQEWSRAHSIWQLRDSLQEGQKLVFNIAHMPTSRFGALNNGNFGESTQAAFLKDLLSYIFPKATFDPDLDFREAVELGRLDGTHAVFIEPSDFAEAGTAASPGFWPLDMRLLKPANPKVLSLPSRDSIRQTLGIGKEKKVLSLYLHNERLSGVDDLAEGLRESAIVREAAHALGGLDFVFVSMPYRGSDDALKEFVFPEFLGKEGRLFSQLRAADLRAQSKAWIYNDTSGLLPYLHKSADLVIVRGPINFHEAVNTGAPTIVIQNKAVLGDYETTAWEDLLKIGTQSGRARSVTEVQQIPTTYAALIKQIPGGPTMRQALSDQKHRNPWDRLLNKLEEIIRARAQVRIPDSLKPSSPQ